MKGLYGLVVRFDIKPEAVEAFDELAKNTLDQIRKHEPETLVYSCHQIADEYNIRIFYERYASRQAFEYHEQQDYIRHFLREREKYLASPPRVEFLSVIDEK